MDTKQLNSRKKELLDRQEHLLNSVNESKRQFSDVEESNWTAMTRELDEININLTRVEAINKGKLEVGSPTSTPVITDTAKGAKFVAFGGRGNSTPLNVNEDYVKGFWGSLKSRESFERFMIQNSSLGESGTTAAGGALVPVQTDPSIPALQIEETVVRSLSRVITTEMNLNLPYQSGLTTSSIKTESNSSGQVAFATNAPTFATTLLSAYTVGDSVYASWELLQDTKAAADFISMDLGRSIATKEEYYFINGTGTNQPQGYLGNATTAAGASISSGSATLGINPIIDTMGTLNRAYYRNASWLVNRQEFNRLFKAQIAANQFQTFIQFDSGTGAARLFGYPVNFSGEMPTYAAGSPVTTGSWLFGDFGSYAVIGDRGDNNIRIKVLDQPYALQGQTVILGYRRADQRILLAQAAVQLNTNG